MREAMDDAGSVVLFPGALGDAICLEPALAALAAHGPVTLYARGAAAEVAALFPGRPRVRSLDAPEVAQLFAPARSQGVRASWLDPFARIVSFTGASVPEVVARLAATGRARVAPFPRPPLSCHASDCFLRTVTGDPHAIARPPRVLAPEPARTVAAPPVLALLPGSGGGAKRAPLEVHAAIAARWRAAGGRVVLLLGPAEVGEERRWQPLGDVVRPASVRELATHLGAAAAFAGNDSGPSHLAAALGRPGVVLYTVTDAAAFGPRGAGVHGLSLDGAAGAAGAAWAVLGRHLP